MGTLIAPQSVGRFCLDIQHLSPKTGSEFPQPVNMLQRAGVIPALDTAQQLLHDNIRFHICVGDTDINPQQCHHQNGEYASDAHVQFPFSSTVHYLPRMNACCSARL